MENAHKKVLESRDGGGEGWRSTLLLPLPLKFARPGKSWIQEQVLESHGKSWNTHVKKVLRGKLPSVFCTFSRLVWIQHYDRTCCASYYQHSWWRAIRQL